MSTHPPSERDGRIHRFSRTERLVHRTTGWLMLLCAAAAACLYVAPLAQLVGRRHLVVIVHEYSGTLLPLPFLLGLASPAFRADLRRLNRFAVYDKTLTSGTFPAIPRACGLLRFSCAHTLAGDARFRAAPDAATEPLSRRQLAGCSTHEPV